VDCGLRTGGLKTDGPQSVLKSAIRNPQSAINGGCLMICPQCGEELKDSARFCSGCGLSFASFDTPSERDESAAIVDTLLHQVLDEKYFILERLGEGGMGIVYRARRVHIGDEVAVKVLHKQLVANADMLERFRREARAAARLRHPNIVSIIDLSEARGLDVPAYIVMELIEGESLRKLLKREECLPVERAVSLMRDICAGVGAAHRRGIFHRDLKPDNVIVLRPNEDRERETVKVVDFGIAKLKDAAGITTLTQTGMVIGTPYYMSPEQCRGDAMDARSDVYSLGAMVYEMLAGEPPFTSETPTGLLARHLFDTVPPLPPSAGVNPALEAVIMRALAKDRDQRQPDASALARELREALQTSGVTSPAQEDEASARDASSQPEPMPHAAPMPESSDEPRMTGEQRAISQEIVATPTIPTYVATPAPFSFKTDAAPHERKTRRVPLVIGALVVLLLVGGAVVWLSMSGNKEKPSTANQGSVEPSETPAKAQPQTVKNSLGMEFVLVPAGSFMMGSENGNKDEKPVHQVTINYSIYMGRYEVTQAQWQQVMGSNPSRFKNCDQCPVEMVTWNDVQEFIQKLNAMNDGYAYRLPSEAEWEYACRAGTTSDYAGDLDAMGWYDKNSEHRTHADGQKQPNGFGLYDMHGNVWEWCEDWYHDNYNGAPTDGSAWLSGGEQKKRVLRGGSWINHANSLRSAQRHTYPPGFHDDDSGIRLVAVAQK
jgi:formylglycine-generating enzyme required for sulfatase activity